MKSRHGKKRRQKKQSNTPVNVPFYTMIWNMMLVVFAYMVRASAGQQAPPQLQSVNSANGKNNKMNVSDKGTVAGKVEPTRSSARTKKRKTKPKTKKNEKESMLVREPKEIVSESAETAAPIKKWQTFSIIPDKETLGLFGKSRDKKEKSNVTDIQSPKNPEKSAKVAAKSDVTTRTFSQPFWKRLKILISNTRLKLIEDIPHGEDVMPVNILISNLAFLYRYHLLNLALKVLIREGDDKNQLHMVRTDIVHKIDAHLFDPGMILETKRLLSQLDLNELNELSSNKRQIDGFEITEKMVNLPLAMHLSNVKDESWTEFNRSQLNLWLKNTGIPLLNTLVAARDNCEDASDCDDAIKMLIIILGEYCPKNDKLDENNFIPVLTGTPEGFLADCRGLRNFYSHKALTDSQEQNLQNFINVYRHLNSNKFKDNCQHFDVMLSP